MTQVYNASWLWARSQWRRSRAPLAVCAVVLAVTGSLVLSAAAAAGRATSAMDRLRQQTGATDLEIGGQTLRGIDAVAAVATNLYFIQRVGVDEAIGSGFFAATQRQLLDQPANVTILLEGRRSDPSNPSEIEVSETFAEKLGLAPGDLVSFESMTDEYLSAWFSRTTAGRPDGPLLDLRVTGIVLGSIDFSNPGGTVYLTEAFEAEYGSVVAHFDFLHVRLRDPSRAIRAVAAV